jgi:putative intracellular protease/amidase
MSGTAGIPVVEGGEYVNASAVGARGASGPAGAVGKPQGSAGRPLAVTGVIAASAVTASGLAVIIMVVLAGWIAAPHAGLGLLAVLRAGAALWLVGQHVGFSLHGTGRIGMLPLGLVLLPGALLWRAGRWVVSSGSVRRLRQVGYAALALAGPYALLTAGLAVASRSAQISASVPQAAMCGFLLALAAGGLGAARALAPWRQLVRLLPDRARSVVVAMTGSVAVLAAAGAILAGVALTAHLHEAASLQRSLGPGSVGMLLLILLQIGYVPNAVVWAIAYAVGPGFAVGTSTVVASTGSALGPLPAFPLLAAIPPGVHQSMPGWLAPVVLALPYLAGITGGWLLIRAAPTLTIEAAPLWGMASGVLAGCLLGVLAAFSGGPLGDGRLAAVGPSGWQVAVVSGLEVGVAAAVTAGVANYLVLRRTQPAAPQPADAGVPTVAPVAAAADAGHVIYLNPWAGEVPGGQPPAPAGPSALP